MASSGNSGFPLFLFLERLPSPIFGATGRNGPTTNPGPQEPEMTKVLVLYYSSYGHIETMADAVAEGVRAAGAEVDVKRVPELVPAEVARASHYKLDQAAPIARPADLVEYDAIIVGTGTRYGRMTVADGELLGPDRRAVGAGRADRQGGRGLHLHRQPARRAGDDADGHPHQPAAPGHGHRRPALFFRRASSSWTR